MMSNGPCSCLPVVPERLPARSSAASTSSGDREHEDVPEPLALQAPQRPPQLLDLLADHVRPEVAVGPRAGCAPGRPAPAGRSTIATGRQWYSRASATSGLRASGCTLVASTTVSLPAASRLRGDEVQHLEGVVGRRLVVLVVGHQPPAEVGREHSVGLKCFRAKVDLPEPEGPIRTTSESSGMRDLHGVSLDGRRRPSAWAAPTSGSSGPTGRKRTP